MISINGRVIEVPVNKINNSNYFQLRDMAELLVGETAQFNVSCLRMMRNIIEEVGKEVVFL